VQWEVEVLDPDVLRGLVLDVVEQYTDRDALTAVLDRERRRSRELDAVLRGRRARHRRR
jgi:hypothetical protein